MASTGPLPLSAADRLELQRIATAASQPYRRVIAARALLLAADGSGSTEIAQRCGTSPNSVRRWRSRFAETGVAGVGEIAPGRGRKRSVRDVTADRIAHDTEHLAPPHGAARWTLRSMAAHHGVSKDTVARVWRERGLRPSPSPLPDGEPQPEASPVPDHRKPDEGDDVIAVLMALNEATGLALSRCRPRDVHRDLLFFVKLTEAIELWVQHWDDPDRPFAWKSREEVVTKTKGARSVLANYTKSATTGRASSQ
jgi:transposase